MGDETHEHLAPDSSMYTCIIEQEPFFVGNVEETPMRDRLFGGSGNRKATPRVKVRVKVDDRDGAVDFVQGTEDGEDNGVITSEASNNLCVHEYSSLGRE